MFHDKAFAQRPPTLGILARERSAADSSATTVSGALADYTRGYSQYEMSGVSNHPTLETRMDELSFLQSLSEAELTELVLIPLLIELNYQDIRYTHGMLEYGKDIVCSKYDHLDGHRYIGFTVKSSELDGSVSSSRSIREVHYQLRQALTTPFVNPFDGNEVVLSHVYLLTPYTISQICIRSLKDELRDLATGVGFIDGPRLRDLLRENIPELLSSLSTPDTRYLHLLQQRLLRMRSIPAVGTLREYTLPEVYTGGSLTPTTAHEAQYLSFTEAQPTEGQQISEITVVSPNIVVIADVGAGKTTLLEKYALDLVTSASGTPQDITSIVPFLIRLSSLPASVTASADRFRNWLEEEMMDAYGEIIDEVRERALILLDGFDEVRSGHTELGEFIQELPQQYPVGVILTSRPSRIPQLASPFAFYRLDPFNETDILVFLTKWLPGEPEKVQQLHSRILQEPTLRRFCRTPLLLTLYTALATSTKVDALPTRRTDIYEATTELLLGEWDAARNVVNQFSTGIKLYYLETLAYLTHKQGRRHIPRELAVRTASEILNSQPKTEGLNPAVLLDEIVYRSSLLRPIEGQGYEFVHLSFQEFFCAKNLVRRVALAEVQKSLYADWWKNALAFYFGLLRSMDHLRITEKKASGVGHWLMEYLSEADLTSQPTKQTIFSVVARQVLSDSEMPEAVLDIYRRHAEGLVPALRQVMQRAPEGLARGEHTRNYLRFLMSLGPSAAPDLTSDLHLVRNLGAMQVLELLADFPVLLSNEVYSNIASTLFRVAQLYLGEGIDAYSFDSRSQSRSEIQSKIRHINRNIRQLSANNATKRRKWLQQLSYIQEELGGSA
jgi:hypothetical protein